MAKKNKRDRGFQSAAGLIRYFDEEEKTAFNIDPKLVIALCIATGVIVTVAKYMWPL
jgi:preprotein translocase subunit Sec61beta